MSFGKDLQEFVQAFSAGYNMIGQSQKDKAAMEESKARTGLIQEQTKEMPAKAALEASQSEYYRKRGEWYDNGAVHTTVKGDPNNNIETSTANDLMGGNGAIPDSSGGQPQQYAPGDLTAPPPATSDDALPAGFNDPVDAGASDAGSTSTPDVSNYAPASGGSAVAPQASAAPAPPQHLAQLFPAVDQRYNLPPGYAQTVSAIETGHTYNPAIVNPNSQATGLFQFLPSTAKKLGIDPANPASAAHGFGQLTNANQQLLSKSLGRPPSAAELYLAHQQGPTAAALMLNNPNVPAIDALTRTYQLAGSQNPRAMAQQALVGNGGSVDMTSGAFATKWMNQFNRENARIAGGSGSQQAPQVAEAAVPANPGAPASDAYAPSTGDSQVDSNLSDLNSYLNPPAKPAGGDTALGAVTAVGNNPAGKPVPLTPLQQGLKAGLGAVSDRFAPQGTGAVPTQQGQPNVHGYLSGDTGAPPNVVQALRKLVPGADKMNDGEFGAAAISYIMETDKLTPAKRAAAVGDLLQYYRNGFNQYAAIAKAAVQSGNLDDAVKASVKAYMHVPDGQAITAVKQDDSGKYLVTFKDETSGKVTSQQLLSPDEMGAQIMKTTPVLFDQALAQMIATPQKPTTITDAGRKAAASLANGDTDAAQAIGEAQTPADVVTIKTAAALQDKDNTNRKAQAADATQFATGLSAQFDSDIVKKNLGTTTVGIYKSTLANHQVALEAAITPALKKNTIAEVTNAANNILEIKGMDPDAPPSFTAKTDGKSTEVSFEDGDITLPTSTFKAILRVRQDIVKQLGDQRKQAAVQQTQDRRGTMSQPDQGGGGTRAIPASGDNPWTPSPGNIPGPAPAPGPWDAPLGATSAVDPNDPKRLNLPSAF